MKQFEQYYPEGWEFRAPGRRTKLVKGVGVNDAPYVTTSCPVFQKWVNMLKSPSQVCEPWLSFMAFRDWFFSELIETTFTQAGEAQLVNTLLSSDLIHSPSNNLLVPAWLNHLTCGHGASRSKYGMGVSLRGSRYIAKIRFAGESTHIGDYATSDEAAAAYKEEKLFHVATLSLPKWLPAERVRARLTEIVKNQK